MLSPHCCCQGQNHPPSCLLASGMAITKSALTNGALSITQRGTHPIGMGPSWLPTPPPDHPEQHWEASPHLHLRHSRDPGDVQSLPLRHVSGHGVLLSTPRNKELELHA